MSSPGKVSLGQSYPKGLGSPASDHPDDNKIIPSPQSEPCMRHGPQKTEATPIHVPECMEKGVTVFVEVCGMIFQGLWSLASTIVRLLIMILKILWSVLVIALAIDFLSEL